MKHQQHNSKEIIQRELQTMVWYKALNMQVREITSHLEWTSRNWNLEEEPLDKKNNSNPTDQDNINSENKETMSQPNSNIRTKPQLDDNKSDKLIQEDKEVPSKVFTKSVPSLPEEAALHTQ